MDLGERGSGRGGGREGWNRGGGRGELGREEGGKAMVGIYCMRKNLFSIKRKENYYIEFGHSSPTA